LTARLTAQWRRVGDGVASTTQRRFRKAPRKAGFEAMVSTRALMSRWPMAGSRAQDGISPQRRHAPSGPAAGARMTGTGWDGATL
jgi:hypothetical protein